MTAPTTTRTLMIGELARHTGVNVETIRYYERVGLIPSPPRTAARQRIYGDEHLRLLRFVKRGRELGFSIENLRALLGLSGRDAASCGGARRLTLSHLADVRGKIASLRKLERALRVMSEACSPGAQKSCPIIDTLNGRRDVAPLRRAGSRPLR